MTDLSIVIVNYRSWSKLDKCLQSLEQQTNGAQQVIVVDNCSDDGQIESFEKKFTGVNWIKNKSNEGFAAGCN